MRLVAVIDASTDRRVLFNPEHVITVRQDDHGYAWITLTDGAFIKAHASEDYASVVSKIDNQLVRP